MSVHPFPLPPGANAAALALAIPDTGSDFDNIVAWWLSHFKPTTQATYATYIPRWVTWLESHGVARPEAATRAHLELWLREVALSGKAPATVAVHYDAVASLYKFLYEEELIEKNPCARATRPKIHYELQKREVLTILEYAAYLQAARALGPNHHAIAVLGGMLGLRASEVASLTVASLSQQRGYTVLTFMGKGDKPARVPVPIPALAAIQDCVDGRSSGPLLRTATGNGMSRRDVFRYVRTTAKAAGISRPISPHALRRTVATTGLNQGVPLRDVQNLMRHARSETTLRSYDMGAEVLERHASHQIAGFLAGWAR